MTIDLDELRRLADEVVLKDWRKRSAGAWKEKWVENERGHEVVRGSAEQTAAVSFIAAANPATVLALLDRLAAAAPEWTVHLTLARAPGVLSEADARRALKIGGGL